MKVAPSQCAIDILIKCYSRVHYQKEFIWKLFRKIPPQKKNQKINKQTNNPSYNEMYSINVKSKTLTFHTCSFFSLDFESGQ